MKGQLSDGRELAHELLLAALAFGTVLYVWPRDDTFFTTLLALPWIVVGLCSIARRIRADVPVGIRVTFAVTTLGLVFRHRLGWPQVDAVWATALLLLLGAFIWHLLPGMRRRLKPNEAPGWIFFALPLLAHAAIMPWAIEQRQPDGDEPYYLLLSHSLTHDQDIELSNNYDAQDWQAFMDRPIEPQPGDPKGSDGEIYSRHNALLPLLMVPFFALGGRFGVALAMVAMTAWLAWLTLHIALRLWPDRSSGSFRAWAMLAFVPPLTVYSHQVWVEIPAALLFTLGLDAALRLHKNPTEGSSRAATSIAAFQLVLALVLLPLLKMRFLLVAAPLAAMACWPLRRRTGAVSALVGGLGFGLTAMLAFNTWRYGNPLKMYSPEEWKLFLSPPEAYARGAFGMFYDCTFGLFAVAPLWLLLIPALWGLIVLRERFLAILLGLMGPSFITLAPRLEWYGGWSPPFRYPMVCLPLLALALVPLFERRSPGLRWLISTLGGLTALLSIFWLVIPGWIYHLADGGNDPLHRLGWILQADIVRLFPSTIRPRLATWAWIVGSLALIPIASWNGKIFGRRLRYRASTAALGIVWVAAVTVPLMARSLPTAIVHWEDDWIAKRGGRLEPDRWMPARPSKVGAWMLPSRGELRAEVVAGSDQVRIRLIARREKLGSQSIQVFAGDRQVAVLPVKKFVFWETLETDVVDWPRGAPLILRGPDGPPSQDVGIMIDRAELDWL